MSGRIDEFSHMLGSLESCVRGLSRDIDKDREIADQRHRENQAVVRRIEETLIKLSLDVEQDRAIVRQETTAATLDRTHLRQQMQNHDIRLRRSETIITHVGKVIVTAGAVVSTVLYLVWQGIVAFGGDIKSALIRIFN